MEHNEIQCRNEDYRELGEKEGEARGLKIGERKMQKKKVIKKICMI